MSKRITFLILVGLMTPMNAKAQSVVIESVAPSDTSALLTRQQQRMEILEQGLKEVRGVVETDLREIKLKVDQLGSSSVQSGTSQLADLSSLRAEMEKLSDMLAMTSRRMERTLEITSDTEFRLLRLEKRVQTLISLGGDAVSSAAAQQETSAANAPPNVKMCRDITSGSMKWSVEEQALNKELENFDTGKMESSDKANLSVTKGSSKQDLASPESFPGTVAVESASQSQSQSSSLLPVESKVLPAVSPEEQYKYALGRAMQNDLEVAESAFAEFRAFNKGHLREADAIYWLGRVQFNLGQYEKAAMTFSEFNSEFPEDKRVVNTSLLIAESVSHFAPQEQACEIYASLPKLLDTPPDSFMTQLSALSDAAKCNI